MGDIEELIDNVLVGQHPKMRERCIVDRIVSVLEAFGAYERRCRCARFVGGPS